jgi:hypothetical protein
MVLRGAGDDDDVSTIGGKLLGDGGSDSAAGSGDDHAPSSEAPAHARGCNALPSTSTISCKARWLTCALTANPDPWNVPG